MSCIARDEDGACCSADAHKSSKFDPVDSTAEWRSWEHLEASSVSTSPPWDSDDDEDSGTSVSGPRPSDLYGKFTWKIENFSQISKRELRSNVFEVGGYKWYILVYPQGCDVCNHLSLFLCVADYDKLLPGWSHFAQFTIAVVNKDSKKSKYSDTLHRFCKKEHDWGWKKFMELSKVWDGFTVADTLVIKAQVQVIRENPHRPFRCLDCQYRRELVRVYLTNVEGICRRFVEEKREKIGKLMEDTVRWSSFRGFWSAVEENMRRRLSREKIETILKAIVKCFFNEKEVTSTLVMDALYSGCKALDYRSKNKKGRINGVEVEETVNPVISVDKEFFVLAGDVLLLLERAANESLPPYKDDKGPQNRTKDGGPGDDCGKDSVDRDERRLTELGRHTVEMFVLAHLFSNRVEVAYREAIALRRQEELIREEEAAGQAEIELKAKREAAEKEKRTKKKQAKQRRSNRKEKEREAEEKRLAPVQEARQREDSTNSRNRRGLLLKSTPVTTGDMGDEDDDLSVLDATDDIIGTLGPAMEDVDVDRALWGQEGSEMHQLMDASFSGGLSVGSAQNGRSDRKHQGLLDDSSSTCSSDSIPSIGAASNGSSRARSIMVDQSHHLINRGRTRDDHEVYDKDLRLADTDGMLRGRLGTVGTAEASSSCSSGGVDSETIIASLKQRVQWLQKRLLEKEEEVVILHEQLSLYQHHFGSDIAFDDKKMLEHGDRDQRIEPPDVGPSSFKTQKNDRKPEEDIGTVTANDAILTAGSVVTPHSSDLTDGVTHSQRLIVPPSDSGSSCSSSALSVPSTAFISSPGSSVTCQVAHPGLSASLSTETVFSRPSSAPGLVAAPGASFPMVQQVHPAPPLARSASATGRLGITAGEPTMSTGPAMQQSPPVTPYRNAAVGVIRGNSMVAHSLASVSSVSNGGAGSQGGSGSYPYLSGGYTHGPSHPLSGSNCVGDLPALVSTKLSGNESQTEAICGVEVMENLSAHRSDHGQRSMGFTFGTVTPEMIHLQHQQDQQRECADGSLQYMELDVQRQDYLRDQQLRQQTVDKKEMLRIIQHQVYTQAHEAQKNNRILQQDLALNARAQLAGGRLSLQMAGEAALSAGPVSEEFPHLDIINDLLDDEKIYGAKALNAFLQQPGNQGFQQLSFQELHNMCSGGPLHPEIHSIQGNGPERIDRGRPCDEGGRSQLAIPSDHTHSGLRESIQLLHTYPHPPLPRSFSQHGGLLDGVSGQHWTGAHGDVPVTSCANGVRSGMDVFVGYPIQSAHLPIADCPTFTMGQNGYTMYSPLKHP